VRDEEDENWADDDEEYNPKFPGTVKAAGIIWIVLGALETLNGFAGVALQGVNQAGGPQTTPAGGICPILIGVVFVVCGHQTLYGKAKDTLGNSVGSIVFGLLLLLSAAVFALLGAGVIDIKNQFSEIAYIIAVFLGSFGSLLILAGFLALSGRSAYREWRKANVTSTKRRRKPRRDDNDDDSEEGGPRRRRTGREDDEYDDDERPRRPKRSGDEEREDDDEPPRRPKRRGDED
jgi:hypothetical protein